MLRYLKYVFLVFASLAIAIGSFFFFNNKHDVITAFNARKSLSYESVKTHCPKAQGQYYYPCFKDKLKTYMESVSITGVSIGLKMAFNFLEEDKSSTTLFKNDRVRDLHYSINFLEINNMAIDNSYKRYFGFDFTYAGFVGKLRDYFKSAYEFSENIIDGLRGKDGIASIQDPEERQQLTERFEKVVKNFHQLKKDSSEYVDKEVQKILEEDKIKN